MTLEEIKNKLKKLAYERTTPFCYTCYKKCPDGLCHECGSDDLMLHLEGVGVEFGTDWVVENILEEELEEVDISESFEQMIEDCYGETTKIGFIEYSIIDALKNLDPIAWDIAKGEHIYSLIQDEEIIEICSRNYWHVELISFLE